MAITIPRGHSDETIDRMIDALKSLEADHPHAQIDIYRQNPVSIRLRVVDPDFRGVDKSRRHDIVWKYLENLPEDDQGDLSMLVVLTPEEVSRSFANMEFEDPVPSLM